MQAKKPMSAGGISIAGSSSKRSKSSSGHKTKSASAAKSSAHHHHYKSSSLKLRLPQQLCLQLARALAQLILKRAHLLTPPSHLLSYKVRVMQNSRTNCKKQ